MTAGHHLAQVARGHGEGGPDPAQVGQGEGIAGLIDHLAHGQVFFHHHRIERCAQFIAVAGAGRAHGGNLLPGIGHGDLGLLQRLAGLQVVLLGADACLPQLLLALERQARQFQAALGGLLFAAQVGNLLAGNHRQHLATLDRLAQLGLYCLDHAWHAWHNVRGAVFVEADLTWETDGAAQFTGAGGGQLYPGSFELGRGKVQRARFFAVAFAGRCFGMAVAVFALLIVHGLRAGGLAEGAGPGHASKAENGNCREHKGDLAWISHCCSCCAEIC